MGLINIYNSVSKLRPHITYRFCAQIKPFGGITETNFDDVIEFSIKNISFPTFSISNDNKRLFGNTQVSFPTIKFGEREMNITFEETDDMMVFKTLSHLYGGKPYNNESLPLVNIKVTQFEESMLTIVDEKTYVCRISQFDFPTFNNNDYGSPIELKASFYVLYSTSDETELAKIKLNDDGSTKHKETHNGLDNIFNQYMQDINAQERAEEEKRKNPPLPAGSGSGKPLPKGKNTDIIQGGRALLLQGAYDIVDPAKREQFIADIDKYSADTKLSKAEKEQLKKDYGLSDGLLDDLQGSLGAERLFNPHSHQDNLKMTAEEYENTKMFLNNVIKLQIEAEIANGNKDWEKHTRRYKNAEGEEVEATYYTYAGKASYVNDEGKTVTNSFNREKLKEFKDQKVEDVAFHTTGNYYANLDTVLSDMARGGQAATMFEDFAIVKKETVEKGRAHSAFGPEDYADDATRKNTLGIEYVSASGVHDKNGLHTTHSTGRSGYIEIVDESGKKARSQVEAVGEVVDDKIRAKGSKNALYHNESQDLVLKAVTDDMNERGVGAFNFSNATIDSTEHNQSNIHKNQRGKTELIAHDNVSNKGKEGESSVDAMESTVANINSWTAAK